MPQQQPLDGSQCQICFAPYTSESSHRITSLKCGHVFGKSCIEEWFKNKKSAAYCPLCFAPSRKTHLREIFVSAIEVLDCSKVEELIAKYNEERALRKELEQKISYLQAELEIKAMELKESSKKIAVKASDSVCKKLSSRIRILPSEHRSIYAYSFQREYIYQYICKGNNHFISYRSIKNYLRKGKRSIRSKPIQICSNEENAFGGSPFRLLVLFEREVVLLRGEELEEEKHLELDVSKDVISAACFNSYTTFTFFVVDKRGEVRHLDFDGNVIDKLSAPIQHPHTIYHRSDEKIVIVGVFKILCIDIKSKFIEVIELKAGEVCTYVSVFGKNMLLSFRSQNGTMKYETFGDYARSYFPLSRQTKRLPSRIYGDHLYILDESQNLISVVNIVSMRELHKYTFQEDITDFFVNKILVVITKDWIYIFDSGDDKG